MDKIQWVMELLHSRNDDVNIYTLPFLDRLCFVLLVFLLTPLAGARGLTYCTNLTV